jgi:hypothetical protein
LSLLEILVVLSIVVGTYSILAPNLDIYTEAQVSLELGRIRGDILELRDQALLSGVMHRVVFRLDQGEYFFERCVSLCSIESKDQGLREPGELPWEEYTRLQRVEVSFDNKILKWQSPLTKAQEIYQESSWERVQESERKIGDQLVLYELQASHHEEPLKAPWESGAIAMVYAFADGSLERAYFRIGYRSEEALFDENKNPYTLLVNPNDGTVSLNFSAIPGPLSEMKHEVQEF